MKTEIGRDIEKAAAFLNNGELIAIPTETVYGLAANALNEDAVLKIYSVKQRPRFNPLILHVASFEQVLQFTNHINREASLLAQHFWPGPLTLLLNKTAAVPDLITAGSNRVAVRVPNHALTLSLLRLLKFPVAAPSANPSGYVSPTSAKHVWKNLNGKIPYILDGGECSIGLESTILGWNEKDEPEIYRPGGIAVEAIEEILKKKLSIKKTVTDAVDTPGQLKSHYATHTPLHLGLIPDLLHQFNTHDVLLINYQNFYPDFPIEKQFLLSPSGSLEEAAKNLFQTLRAADEKNAAHIFAEPLPDYGLGIAINDRLERAQFRMK